jgi:hypothetical protein
VQVIALSADDDTELNPIANPDNSVMTATITGVKFIDFKAEDDVETEIEPVVVQSLDYESMGNNIYKVKNVMSDGSIVETDTLILAGQDRDPETDEDNDLLSGRTVEKGGSIEVGTIYLATTEDDDTRITKEAYYTIKGAKADYYVTAGSDGMLGTWDDIVKDSTSENKLGTYNLDNDGLMQSLGWVFVKGNNVNDMLLASEYVLDSVAFNETLTTAVYSGSTLEAKMKEIYDKVGGNKTAIKQNQTISMADYTGEVEYICNCTVEGHIDDNGYHVGGTTKCSGTYKYGKSKVYLTANITGQKDVTGTFFALSIEEIANAYNGIKYRLAKYAKCGTANATAEVNYEGTIKIQCARYWLRSPGYCDSSASYIATMGSVETLNVNGMAETSYGARPACYATLI